MPRWAESLEVELSWATSIVAESPVKPGVVVQVHLAEGVVELYVCGDAGERGFIEAAPTVTCPWEAIREVELNAAGSQWVLLPSLSAESVHFFRIRLLQLLRFPIRASHSTILVHCDIPN